MTDTPSLLRRFLIRAYRWRIAYGFLEMAYRFLIGYVGVVAALSSIVFLFSPALRMTQVLWSVGLAVSGLYGVSVMGSPRQWGLRKTALRIGEWLAVPDGFLNAWELSRMTGDDTGISRPIAEKAINQVLEELSNVNFRERFSPGRVWAKALVCLAVLTLIAGSRWILPAEAMSGWGPCVYPFGHSSLMDRLLISPGDYTGPRRKDVTIRISDNGPAGEETSFDEWEPELWVRSPASQRSGPASWEKRLLSRIDQRTFIYPLAELLDPLVYRVRWRGETSREFQLSPVEPVQFERLHLTVVPPPYTGLPSEELSRVLTVRALTGSRITVRGELNKPVHSACLLFSDDRILPVRQSDALHVESTFDVTENADFSFQWVPPGAPSVVETSERFHVDVIKDQVPSIQILSPAQDLLLSLRDPVRLVYRAVDDYGVAEIRLAYQIKDGPVQDIRLKSIRPAVQEKTDEAVWRLDSLPLKPGDRLRYYLTVVDLNTLTGPLTGRSAVYTLEIASYDEEHLRIDSALQEFRHDLLSALAEQTLIREGLKSVPRDSAGLVGRQSELQGGLLRKEKALSELLDRMSKDPLTDRLVWYEHEGMRNLLGDLNNISSPRAMEALRTGDDASAGRAMEEIISTLERMTLLSEDVSQAQKMRALFKNQEALTESIQTLSEEMGGKEGTALRPEDQKKLTEIMRAAHEMMDRILRQLQSMPQELPEEFINQPSVKNLRLDQVQSGLNEIQSALNRGDASSALAAARQVLDRLTEMQRTLREASRNVPGEFGWFDDRFRESYERSQAKLQELVDRQRGLRDRTLDVSKRLVPRLLEAEKALLAELETDFDKHIAALNEALVRVAKEDDISLAGELRFRVTRILELAAQTRIEVGGRALSQAPRNAQESRGHYEEALRGIERAGERLQKYRLVPSSSTGKGRGDSETFKAAAENYAALTGRFSRLKEGEDALYRRMAPLPEKTVMDETEGREVREIQSKQVVVEKDTRSLRSEIQDMARQTAVLEPKLIRRLSDAADAMGKAVTRLDDPDTHACVSWQEKALRLLEDSHESMSSGYQSLTTLGKSYDQPLTGSLQPMGSHAPSGGHTGIVHIPGADEFKPPREFREELLQSMKEKYPKIHERMIRDYYERWAPDK
ncbi:MAG TPA: DUF4175 family protein [Elusimicrobiota bacterium]|nr:DUF4175 family protein [Elusimicrobiota bacterium]